MKILYYNLAKQWRSLINSKGTVHYFCILKRWIFSAAPNTILACKYNNSNNNNNNKNNNYNNNNNNYNNNSNNYINDNDNNNNDDDDNNNNNDDDNNNNNILSELKRRITVATSDMKETSYLYQRISVALQRFNEMYMWHFSWCLVWWRQRLIY